jgi:hypothetical protein
MHVDGGVSLAQNGATESRNGVNEMKGGSMSKFNWDQRMNFKRAVRLNSPATFAELRSLYESVRAGTQFGCYSGYSP